jgi:stage IV sporulation protein A
VSCIDLDAEDIRHILELVLHEFPVSEIRLTLPEWTTALDDNHVIKTSIMSDLKSCAERISKAGDIKDAFHPLENNEYIKNVSIDEIDMGTGSAKISATVNDGLYYDIISELTGFEISGEEELISLLKALSEMKARYDKIESALDEAEERGYGIVMPDVGELKLAEPQIVKQPGGYGVKLKASAQSIHMIRANIETEINPIVGTEQQSEDLVKYMLKEFEEDPQRIWESNMFGKSLYELMNEGLHTKLEHMPEASRIKLSETLERIINEGSGGLICIIL